MSMEQEITKTYTERELHDIIQRMIFNKLSEIEPLFSEIARNPNIEKYHFYKKLFEKANIKSKEFEFVLFRIKARGIKKEMEDKLSGDFFGFGIAEPDLEKKEVEKEEGIEIEF